MLIAKHNCGQQEEPATLFSRLLLRMPGTYKAASLVWTSTKNEWNAQDAICTRSRVFWPSITWTLHKARCWCKEGCKSVLTFDRCRPHSVTFGYYHLKYVAVFRAEPFRVRTDLWMRNSRPFSDFFKKIISFSGNIRQTREQGFSQDDTNFSTEAHVPPPRYGTTISSRQWQPWTSASSSSAWHSPRREVSFAIIDPTAYCQASAKALRYAPAPP